MSVLFTVLVTFFAGMGAGLGTGFAGMSAAAVIIIAMAILCSVTVSMAALIIGIFKTTFFVRCVVRSIMFGVTSEYCGTNNTSSNVMPSPMIVPISTVSSLSFILMCFVYYLTI